jgi:hypothetical protein
MIFCFFIQPRYRLLKDDFVPDLREQWEKDARKREREAKWAAIPKRISSRVQALNEQQAERERQEREREQRLEEERERRAVLAAAR